MADLVAEEAKALGLYVNASRSRYMQKRSGVTKSRLGDSMRRYRRLSFKTVEKDDERDPYYEDDDILFSNLRDDRTKYNPMIHRAPSTVISYSISSSRRTRRSLMLKHRRIKSA